MATTNQNHRNAPAADEAAASQNLVSSKANQDAEEFEDVDKSTAAVVVPPDSGWAWVVMVASFLCCTIIDGIVFCSGFIQDDLIKEFNVSKFYVSFVSSLLSGCYLMAGPFVSAMANRFGFRPVTIAGALFAAVCFVLSSYVNSIELLMVVYGVLGGIGFCMVYIPAVVIIGFYFEKWRALATGIAMCGSGVGTFVFAPLSNYLLHEYGWRRMLQVQGMIIIACAIIGIAFRPIQPLTLAVTENGNVEEDNKNKANGHGNTVAPKQQFATNAFSKPLPEGRFAYSMPNSAHNTYMGSSPKHHYPTAAEVFKGANLERRLSGASGKGTEMKNLRKSQPTTPNGEPSQMTFNLNKELTTVGENEEETENENLLVTEAKPTVVQARRHTVSGKRPLNIGSRSNVGSQDAVNTAVTRPMYRDDIFFSGSLTRIPQYQSQSSLAYHMSVTRLPTKQDQLEERESGCNICPEAVRRTLSTMLDVTLLKSPSFMLLAFSGFLTMMGFFVPFTFLKPRAVFAGMEESGALQVVSAIGYFNTIARIFCGSITSFPSVKPLWLNNIAITAGGIATICSGFIITTATQWTFAVLFGFCIACFSALRSLIAVEMIGLEKLTNAFGFLMLFQGIAATIGSPIAGALYDATQDYNACFYFSGSLILLSAFLCYPLPAVARWENKRNEKNTLPAHA
ncbi:monocarboxylate transporter 9 [Haematobia irritans]|uniref:Putative monocarboxylate transporter n=2 Tax=Haematobia irritans TaxID=7368 RepID=A0A1L8EFV5_HAEIR